MQKLRQIVSDLATDLKAINLDDRLSYRYLASLFKNEISIFLRQDARSREVIKDSNIWKTINCVNLIDVPYTECGYVSGCNTLKRSEIKIPEAFNTNYGQLLKIVNILYNGEFKVIKPFEYTDYLNREYGNFKSFCWLQDNYIYIPNTQIETIRISIIPKEPIEVDKINGIVDECVSPLDGDITYPDYLIALAKKEVYNKLTNSKQITEDEKGDDNSNNKK